MGGPKALLQTAASQIGTVEVPVNRTKYGREYGLDGNAWCQMFVWWCLRHSGNGDGGWEKSAWTPDWEKEAKHERRNVSLRNNTVGAKPGMVVHFYSHAKGRIAHVGIIERVLDRNHIVTIEGNTSPSRHGSQRNGGQVARRHRYVGPRSSFVASCSMPVWGGGQPDVNTPEAASKNWFMGTSGTKVAAIQRMLGFAGSDVDGIFGGVTKRHVRAFQERHGLTVDGVVGPLTWAKLVDAAKDQGVDASLSKGDDGVAVVALQLQLKEFGHTVTVDGDYGVQTTAAVQAFQRHHGLAETGSVDRLVWQKIATGCPT